MRYSENFQGLFSCQTQVENSSKLCSFLGAERKKLYPKHVEFLMSIDE